jgi:hypothetical protein
MIKKKVLYHSKKTAANTGTEIVQPKVPNVQAQVYSVSPVSCRVRGRKQ